jgi:hypothetical protein
VITELYTRYEIRNFAFWLSRLDTGKTFMSSITYLFTGLRQSCKLLTVKSAKHISFSEVFAALFVFCG